MASTSQRRRELARQRWEKQQARRAAAAARARRRRRVLAVVLVVALVAASVAAAVVWWPWTGDDATTAAEDASASAAAGPCTYTPTEGGEAAVGMPPAAPSTVSTATLTVNGKPVTAELLPDAAPCTVGSFDHLVTSGFFDATTCHRLTTSETLKVLQCGDPTGSGGGGPGYQFGVENTEGATYPAGTVAMARGDDPSSNGSQFFIVYGDSQLPAAPGYTVFGHVTEGLDVVRDIAAAGTADGSPDGAPKTEVTLDQVVTAS